MKKSFPEKCGRVQAGVLALLSMILIWLPALDSFFHLDKSPMPNENRAMAQFPEFQSGSKGLREYISGLELYYNDRFGFRKLLIRWQHLWKHDFFKDSSNDGDDHSVIIGRNGWLFYTGNDTLANLQGFNPFTPDQLEAWRSLLESRRDWCDRRGIAYVFVIPPDKHSIYPEYLPDWLLPVKKPTKLDQFIAYMKMNSTVPVLDLRPALLAAKRGEVVYFLTGTHWNYLGAFMGYQSFIRTLSQQLPDLKPLPLDAFERKLLPQPSQELARMIGQDQSTIETANVVLTPQPPLAPLIATVDTNLFVKKWRKDTEPRFTENQDGKGKAIVFRDSFSTYWIPFLGYNFNKVVYVWQYNWDMTFLEQQKPDVVIDEMLERYLLSVDPVGLKGVTDQPEQRVAYLIVPSGQRSLSKSRR
jgi:alginate O-acetyltransferase complex protein AlgJ